MLGYHVLVVFCIWVGGHRFKYQCSSFIGQRIVYNIGMVGNPIYVGNTGKDVFFFEIEYCLVCVGCIS